MPQAGVEEKPHQAAHPGHPCGAPGKGCLTWALPTPAGGRTPRTPFFGCSLLLLALLLSAGLAAYWATSGRDSGPETAAVDHSPADYPPRLWEELGHLPDVAVQHANVAELPQGLDWQLGQGEPELGDPRARKGGRVRLCNVGPFPANWLAFGSPTLQFFHENFFARLELPLVMRHPVTGHDIPGLAAAWAQQGRTLYFRLDPRARYSNGRPLRAGDFALGLLLRSRHAAGEWAAIRAQIESVCVYGDEYLAVTLRHDKPCAASQLGALLRPAEPSFYAEAAGDYVARYGQRIPPTTGAYTIGKVERGRMVEFVRVKDWWARDERYQRYRFNADAVEHHFLTDEAQAWEFFLRGRLDAIQTRNLTAWQQKLEGVASVEQGRIIPYSFRADYPMPPYGIAVNARRLGDPALRRGIMQALDMDRAVALIFRGEGERLHTFSTGYGELSPKATPEWHYDPAAARASFAEAGYTELGVDGILRRADGTRLSLGLLYSPSDKLAMLVATLVQGAAACGLDIRPEPMPWQASNARLRDGQHELVFWATMVPAGSPEPARYFASGVPPGDDAPFGLQDAEMDAALAAYEAAADVPARAEALATIDRLVQQRAIWLPGWKENLVHLAAWQHLRFPDCESCRFSTPTPYEVMDAYLYWVDENAPAAR